MIHQYHRVAEHAHSAGLAVHIHPNSSTHSMVRLQADYDRLLADIDPALIEFGPDTGHVMRGDETPLALVSRHSARIAHVHVKAHADGAYAFLGTGDAAIPAVVDLAARAWLSRLDRGRRGVRRGHAGPR